jgi:superfamily I DNA/RNA helicase
MAYFSNLPTLKAIFGKSKTLLSDSLREELMAYLIDKYPEQLVYFIKTRFDYVIFDESQDLGGSKEAFAKLLYNSEIPTIFLGDENQRIMPRSGNWF